jgi:hypothetical protein
MSLSPGKPGKLQLIAFSDREMTKPVGSMFVMYNPDTIALNYQTDFTPNVFVNTTRQSNRYVQTRPGGLTLELFFDARMPGNRRPIERQLSELKALCYDVNRAGGEPRYLRVKWGEMRWMGRGYFAGRMTALSVRYTLFDRDATPLQATATLELAADGSLSLQEAKSQLEAPDKAVVTVPDQTPLPMIVSKAASDLPFPTDYLETGSLNNLDSLDASKAGETLQLHAKGADA